MGAKSVSEMKISEKNIKNIFSGFADLECRKIHPHARPDLSWSVFWVDGLANSLAAAEDIIRPFALSEALAKAVGQRDLMERALAGQLWSAVVRRRESMTDIVTDLLAGFVVLVPAGLPEALSFELRSTHTRAIGEAGTEKTLKGAKGAFVETLRVNTALVRRALRSPKLKLEQSTVGRKSGTVVALMYLEDIAGGETVEELRQRLEAIDIDGLIAAGNLEQYIVDAPCSPFPQLIHTERPDKFAAELLEGRVGLLVDGLPIGFMLPATLASFMRVEDDRAGHFLVAGFLTLLRWVSLVMSLCLPALFLAMNMYHQEMLPVRLLQSMIEAKQQVPFSAALELIVMLLAFELLQEAGLRLPEPVGNTVSIIGALIVGQAAVEARLVSPVTVIVVAAAGLSSFTLPSQDLGGAVRLLRLGLVILSAALGLYGFMLGLIFILRHICALESFGLAYLHPFCGGGLRQSIAALTRLPLWMTKRRDGAFGGSDRWNQR